MNCYLLFVIVIAQQLSSLPFTELTKHYDDVIKSGVDTIRKLVTQSINALER